MNEQSDRELLQETHDAIIELKAVVLGVGGHGGLVSDIAEVQMSVKEMTLKAGSQSYDVAQLLKTVPEIQDKVNGIDLELHEPVKGICDRMITTETKQRDNRNLIVALWAIIAGILGALITLFVQHLGQGKDILSSLWSRLS